MKKKFDDKRFYIRLVGKITVIVLLSVVGTFCTVKHLSFTAGLICLLLVLFTTVSIVRSVTRLNRQVTIFFDSLRNNDFSSRFPTDTDEPLVRHLYDNMNRIIDLFHQTKVDMEEKRMYYENIIRVLTHEINNTITPIASLSADLFENADTYGRTTVAEYLHTIHEQSQRLRSFVESYHHLTHLPSPIKQDVHVWQLFDKLKKLLQAEPDSERIRYIIDNGEDLYAKPIVFAEEGLPAGQVFPAKESLSVNADENLLLLALINLLKNALQAIEGQENGEICLTTLQTKEAILIKVADNGPGIPAVMSEAVFNPFFSTKKNGTGIGLSISRRIMQFHRGTLTVTSQPFIKTEFTLSFPSETATLD